MLVVEPGLDDPNWSPDSSTRHNFIFAAGSQSLRWRPLSPTFLLGSLRREQEFCRDIRVSRARSSNAALVSTTVLLEADLSEHEPRDPRTPLIRRLTQIEFLDDYPPTDWWQNLALSDFQLMSLSPAEDRRVEVGDMDRFGREDGHARTGLINVDVLLNKAAGTALLW